MPDMSFDIYISACSTKVNVATCRSTSRGWRTFGLMSLISEKRHLYRGQATLAHSATERVRNGFPSTRRHDLSQEARPNSKNCRYDYFLPSPKHQPYPYMYLAKHPYNNIIIMNTEIHIYAAILKVVYASIRTSKCSMPFILRPQVVWSA